MNCPKDVTTRILPRQAVSYSAFRLNVPTGRKPAADAHAAGAALRTPSRSQRFLPPGGSGMSTVHVSMKPEWTR